MRDTENTKRTETINLKIEIEWNMLRKIVLLQRKMKKIGNNQIIQNTGIKIKTIEGIIIIMIENSITEWAIKDMEDSMMMRESRVMRRKIININLNQAKIIQKM